MLHALVSNPFKVLGAGYNRGQSPESRCLTGTFRRIASYFLVEAVSGALLDLLTAFSITNAWVARPTI
jgi:hypothetical protein